MVTTPVQTGSFTGDYYTCSLKEKPGRSSGGYCTCSADIIQVGLQEVTPSVYKRRSQVGPPVTTTPVQIGTVKVGLQVVTTPVHRGTIQIGLLYHDELTAHTEKLYIRHSPRPDIRFF